jgi:hypothetical protein
MRGAVRGLVEVRSIRSDDFTHGLDVIGGHRYVGVCTPLLDEESHVVLLRSGDRVALIVASDEDHVPTQFNGWEVVWKR